MKKRNRIILTGLPIVALTAGVVIFVIYEMNKKDENTNNSSHQYIESDNIKNNGGGETHDDLLSKFKIFPKLDNSQFYKYIRIVDGVPIINNEFISHVVHKVLKDIQISDGTIDWGYELSDDKQHLSVTFKWNADSQSKVFTKTYHFNVNV